RDTVNSDPVVDRNKRVRRVAVGASCPGGQARLPPHWMGLEDLPGPLPFVIATFVIALTMMAISRPSGNRFADVPWTLWTPEARAIAPCSLRQLLVAAKSDDAQPLEI